MASVAPPSSPTELSQTASQPIAPRRPGPLKRVRQKWNNASIKTSFMVYMLVFLVAALFLSTLTGSIFGALQNEMTADAYEVTGIYVYDENRNALLPARALSVDAVGNELFVQRADDAREPLSLDNPRKSLVIESAQAYPYVYETHVDETNGAITLEELIEGSAELSKLEGSEGTLARDVAAYDALARQIFDEWATDNPGNPYDAFFDDAGASRFGDLLVSPVGFYAHTEPSEEARVLSTLFGLLALLMFPLWFGLCIFAAARRFFRLRLAPGLSTLDEAAANIARQDLDFTVTYDRDDELGRLAASFETMRASLEESQRSLWRTAEERKRLNAAFAHDLRTPLTILKGKIELLDARLQAGDVSRDQLTASVSSLSDQAKRLERYVEAMSGLQKLEDRIVAAHDVSFDQAATMVEDIGLTLAAQSNRAFELSVSPRCDRERPNLHLDQSILGEVAENLIGNAARYARTRIDARIDVQGQHLVLVVEDDGPGFSPDALRRGCAPFFSEAPSSHHFGLGLNIACMLCEKHGGSLALENLYSGGAQVTARFLQSSQA